MALFSVVGRRDHARLADLDALKIIKEANVRLPFFRRDIYLHLTVCDLLLQLAIGVSKKCRPVRWELGAVSREMFGLNVLLPGKHSTYTLWAPPLWLPENVLAELEERLVKKLKEILPDTNPPSTDSSDASSDDEVSTSIVGISDKGWFDEDFASVQWH